MRKELETLIKIKNLSLKIRNIEREKQNYIIQWEYLTGQKYKVYLK